MVASECRGAATCEEGSEQVHWIEMVAAAAAMGVVVDLAHWRIRGG